MGLNETLALANALFTLASTVCMIAGYLAIRRRKVTRHKRLMLAAFGSSVAFMTCFVIRYVRFGPKKFEGTGAIRGFYYFVWFSHEPLAVINVLLVIVTLILGLRRAFENHVEVARIALPVWLYVSITGMLIYVLLYLR